jgi:hypothetical protein
MKLTRIAPAVATVVAAGTAIMMQASPASADTNHNEACNDNTQLCLWYSDGYDSGVFRDDHVCAESNFSYDHCGYAISQYLTPVYDAFEGGTGAGDAVRNDAHSAGDDRSTYDYLYSRPNLKGYEMTIAKEHPEAYALVAGIINNEASYISSWVAK